MTNDSALTCRVPQRQLERGLKAAARLGTCSLWLYDREGRLLAASTEAAFSEAALEGARGSAWVVVGDARVAEVRAVRTGAPRAGTRETADEALAFAADVAAGWMADLWGTSVEVDSLAAEVVHAYEELHLLYELGESLTSRLSVADASDFVLEKIVAALHASEAELYLNDGGVRVYSPPGKRVHPDEPDEPDEPDAMRMTGASPAVGSGSGTEDPGSRTDHSLTTVLRSGGRDVGRIVIGRRPSDAPFSSIDGKLLDAVGTLAANAIRNAQLHEESRRAARALREKEAYLRAVMDNVADGIVTFDREGVIRSFNPAAERAFGYPSQEVVGRHVVTLLADARPETIDAVLGRRGGLADSQQAAVDRREVVGRRRDGATFPMDVAVGEMRLNSERVTILSVRDITERKHAEQLLQHQALHDGLTGLPNRALLHERLRHAVRAAQRDAAAFALLMMDLDQFKDVNDTFGHHFGDMLLCQVGARVKDCLRAPDTVARLGGDEFAVLLPGADAASAAVTAERVLHALERPFLLEGQVIEVGGSIGVALYPEHGADGDTLLRRADVAMYVAKRNRTGHALYAPVHDVNSPERLSLMGELRRGIERGELVLHYQPKVDSRSDTITWAEALVRWNHPTRGQLRPDEFIPLAEQTGLIQPLTAWVLDEALRQCRAWLNDGLRLGVAVNLSARNLHNWALPDQVAELLDKHGIPPMLLKAEITETSLMVDPERAMHILSRLKTMGVQVSIDDFGIGHSSLAYLKNLPVSELKIDKSFVQQMAIDHHDAAIVRSTISLSHELGLEVVAEGVEDEATWNLLAGLGCDLIQGYYVSRPLPAHDLATWLANRSEARTSGTPTLRHALEAALA